MTKVHGPSGLLFLFALVVLAACSGGGGGAPANEDTITPPAVTTTVIGSAGGTVAGYYGAQIIVPAGALASSVSIGFVRDSANSPEFALADVDAVGATYELTPHGTTFSSPVTLRIPFDATQLPDDATPVLYKAESGGAFTALPTTVNGDFLEAAITDFSWVIPAYAATKPRNVYAIHSTGSALELASYKINSTTGALTGSTSTALTGDSPTSVVAHPSRRFVYVTNAGSSTVNGIDPNSVAVYQLNTTNGTITGAAISSLATGATVGIYKPTMPVIHPSGKFLYVMNFGSVSNNAGGDISLFAINGATGALTLSTSVTSGGGAQPMGIAFNPLGTFAYVVYAGSSSSNSFSSTVKVYSVDATTGALTGPVSGVAASFLGSNPWSIAVDANGKFAYVACLSTNSNVTTDQLIVYGIDGTTGALTNLGNTAVTNGSRLATLAADSFGRFLYAGRQQPWLSKNLLSYKADTTTGALTLANDVLTSCPGGGCVGPMAVVAEPQGKFVYAIDVQQGLSAFSVDATTGMLAAAGSSLTGAYVPWTGGIGIPFTFGVTGTHPLWQNNCTHNCAMAHSGGGGSGPITNPTPPTSHFLTVTQGAFFGFVTSTPAGIDYGPATILDPLPHSHFSASFAVNSSVQLCITPPPQPSQAYDVTWTGSCSGTGVCTSVVMNGDKYCHLEFTAASVR